MISAFIAPLHVTVTVRPSTIFILYHYILSLFSILIYSCLLWVFLHLQKLFYGTKLKRYFHLPGGGGQKSRYLF